jgi:hypothetical protein
VLDVIPHFSDFVEEHPVRHDSQTLEMRFYLLRIDSLLAYSDEDDATICVRSRFGLRFHERLIAAWR